MANSNYEDKILDAIEQVVDNAVKKAGYDKTIQCQVVECVDPTIGKYKVKYQDSLFLAYSENADITYMQGAQVYVLIPGNDMSRDKTILGTTKKLGANYVGGPAEDEDAYEKVGSNCIDSNNTYEFCSYKSQTKVVYDKENQIDEIRLNLQSVETYIRQSKSIICGGTFKTQLPVEQQFRGNFGIVFELAFLDNASQDTVYKNYVIDVNQMTGNPYKQTNWRRQYGIFDIDIVNFQYINKIYFFVSDFPHQADNMPSDIFIKDLEFCGAVELTESELNSYGLVLITPQGTYFDEKDLDSAERTVQAQVRVKGKNIDNNSQSLQYYWFIENVSVTNNHPDYCSYGGQGWECKNQKNNVGTDENGKEIFEWVPAGWEYKLTKAESPARQTRYKCVAIYNDIVLSKEVIITNYSSTWDITIESDHGTQFYYDIGTPTLTCKVNGDIKSDSGFTYYWAEIDSANNFYTLAETPDDNNEYNNAVAAYTQLQADIEAERAMPAASQEKLNEYLTTIEKYDKIMRVEKMILHKVQVNQIVTFSTFKCSVYYNGIFIGSSSIVINNSLDGEGAYNLVINNGTQIFKYDEMGISPVNTSLHKPIDLLPLTFTLYDNFSEPIADDILRNCEVKWIIPTTRTLLEIPNVYGDPSETDSINGTVTYDNLLTFSYLIANRYDIAKTNNNIQLVVKYKNMNLIARTNFTFTKEGEAGTNGTEFVCRIVPNVQIGENIPIYPMILNGTPTWKVRQANRWFKLQFWHNGELIFNDSEGTDRSSGRGNLTTENKAIYLNWSMLAHNYDISDFTITNENTGTFSPSVSYNAKNNAEAAPANIVKCSIEYDGVNYYATLPLINATTSSGYDIALKDNSGFRYVVYSADGRQPQWDNSTPFELIVKRTINGYQEDVSRMTQGESLTYTWTIRGKLQEGVKNYLLSRTTLSALEKNQKAYKPVDDYIGDCVNIGLECAVKRGSAVAANIHIPIHFYLNRYGQAALNGWDGNSVSIDKDNNNVILAPQIGAGQKESDNSFTGIFMGKVKEATKNYYEVGLFAYNYGERTVFINSKDGSAMFGKKGNGQMIIDPSQDKALIYSYNFWRDYNDDNKPDSYSADNENGQGLLIDLTTPEIRFGTGYFSVNSEGHIHSTQGDIAGWIIEPNRLYSEKGNGAIEISSDGSISGTNGVQQWWVHSDGSASFNQVTITGGTTGGWTITDKEISTGNIHLYAEGYMQGGETGKEWKIEKDGTATFNNAYIVGNVTANSGKIGNWTINEGSIYNGSVWFDKDGNLKGPNWHINADGDVSFGTNKFHLDSSGNLSITDGNLSGANWHIYNNGEVSFGNGNLFLNTSGDLTVKNGTITGSSFSSDNGKFKVDKNGKLTSTSGTIGGWTINDYKLYWEGGGKGVCVQIPGYEWESGKYTEWVFAAGSMTSSGTYSDCEFRVNKDGTLYASGAVIQGTISASKIVGKSSIFIGGAGTEADHILGVYPSGKFDVRKDGTDERFSIDTTGNIVIGGNNNIHIDNGIQFVPPGHSAITGTRFNLSTYGFIYVRPLQDLSINVKINSSDSRTYILRSNTDYPGQDDILSFVARDGSTIVLEFVKGLLVKVDVIKD